MYREHGKPMYEGYLRGFVPPNKVIVSRQSNSKYWKDLDSVHNTHWADETNTITLLGLSDDKGSKDLSRNS